MSSFKGRFTYSVDNKGRLALPAKLRKSVSTTANGSFIILRGFERCLYIYPQDEWNKLEESIRGLTFSDAQNRFFSRTLLGWATDCQLDSQQRIMLSQEHMEYAGIRNEVLILGVLERIELWDPTIYLEYEKNQPATYETVVERVLKPSP
jgi:MraZ protein